MTLKEAFRYQNFLSSIFDTIMSNMSSSYACLVTETHLRSKANQDAEDEVVDRTSKRCFDCTVDQLIDVAQFIIKEKELLSVAIADAKYRDCMYMDANVSVNAARRQLQTKLHMLCRIKPDELETTSTGYRFNVEGNQVPYNYKVIRTIKPDLNQPNAKDLSRNLARKADEVSADIDRAMTTVELHNFTPSFDPSDSLDDVINTYLYRLCELCEDEAE